MTYLLSAVVILLTYAIRKLYLLIKDKKLARAVTILITFLLALIGSVVYYYIESRINWQVALGIWTTAIGVNEILFKTLLVPVFEKVKIALTKPKEATEEVK